MHELCRRLRDSSWFSEPNFHIMGVVGVTQDFTTKLAQAFEIPLICTLWDHAPVLTLSSHIFIGPKRTQIQGSHNTFLTTSHLTPKRTYVQRTQHTHICTGETGSYWSRERIYV